LVVAESIVGLTVTALATGWLRQFSPTAHRVQQRRRHLPVNGVPTLQLRVGNERGNRIVDAVIRASVSGTERTAEGKVFYRNIDLTPVRERLFSLSAPDGAPRSDRQPFYGGLTPELLVEQELGSIS
jgi:inward rectifier potassium channel